MDNRCPKCGSAMVNNIIPDLGNEHERLGDFLCPLDPKDCRIKELAQENETLRAILAGYGWAP